MKFSFEVGVNEKHIVDFSFNQFLGNLSIHADGKKLISDFRMFSLSLTKSYEFTVGKDEIHHVKIDKIRKLVFAGLRRTKYKVFIDGVLTNEFEGR